MTDEMSEEKESVTIQPIRRMDAFGFVPDISLELPAREGQVSAGVDKKADKLSRTIDPSPVLTYLILESNPTLRGLMKAVGKVDRPPEFQNLDLMSPKDRAQNAAFALGTIRAAEGLTENLDIKNELEAVDNKIVTETNDVVSGKGYETSKRDSGLIDKALRKLPIKVLSLTTIAAFLAGCAGVAVTPKTQGSEGTATRISEVSKTATGVATTPTPSETSTETSTPSPTETSTATEVQFEPLTLQTNSENPAEFTDITVDDIKSGRVSYWEHQAYEKGDLPQFSPDTQFLPSVVQSGTLSLSGLAFDQAGPDWNIITQGEFSSHPDTLPMRFVTYYKMTTDSGAEIWIAGLEVLNKDKTVSFLHLGFNAKDWKSSGTAWQSFLEATSKGLRVPAIISKINTCDTSKVPSDEFYWNWSNVCKVYTQNWDETASAAAVQSWAQTGQVTPDMEDVIYIYSIGITW